MFTIKRRDTEKIIFALFLWGTLFPYPFWGVAYILVIILLVHTFFCVPNIIKKKVKSHHLVYTFVMVTLIFVFHLLNEASFAWSFIMAFSFLFFLFIIKKQFMKYMNYFEKFLRLH